jgi:hypothetical protein
MNNKGRSRWRRREVEGERQERPDLRKEGELNGKGM